MLVIETPITQFHRIPHYRFPLRMRITPILPPRRIRKGIYSPIYGYKPRNLVIVKSVTKSTVMYGYKPYSVFTIKPKPIATFAYGYKPKWYTFLQLTIKNSPYGII